MVTGAGSNEPSVKPVEWVASSREDLAAFPIDVRKSMGYALYLAQCGEKSPQARPLRGFGGAGVLEIIASHDGNAYRAVYTVRFAEAVFVLHAFQKKSKRGTAMPRADAELIARRLQAAAEYYRQNYEGRER